MALTPYEWRKGLTQKDLETVEQLEREIDLTMRNNPPSQGENTFTFLLLERLPNENVQQELTRRYTETIGGIRGWSKVQFLKQKEKNIIVFTAPRATL